MKKINGFLIVVYLLCFLAFLILQAPFHNQKFKFKKSWFNLNSESSTILLKNITCYRKPFQDILLVLAFNFPFYENIPYLRLMYEDVFSKVVFCGVRSKRRNSTQPDIVFKRMNQGYFAYHCAALAMQSYPGFKGYMYGNDDMIINWWNLVQRDRNKIWQGPEKIDFRQIMDQKNILSKWVWWNTNNGLPACRRFYKELENLSRQPTNSNNSYQVALSNGNGFLRCGKGWSDFFYIPDRLSSNFITLSTIAFNEKLYLEIAVNIILRSLDHVTNFEITNGVFLPDIGVRVNTPKLFWAHYDLNMSLIHPFKINRGKSEYNTYMLKKIVICYSQTLLMETYKCVTT